MLVRNEMLKYKVVWTAQTGNILYFIFIPPFTAWIGTSGYPRCGVVREKMLVLRWDELYKAEPGMEFQCSPLFPRLHPFTQSAVKKFFFSDLIVLDTVCHCVLHFLLEKSRIKSLNMIKPDWQKVKHQTDQTWSIFHRRIFKFLGKLSELVLSRLFPFLLLNKKKILKTEVPTLKMLGRECFCLWNCKYSVFIPR